ncbi:MAG: LexA family transcriptional regulator [Phycisphaerae bacterium]|nr:LexA family transcriptional regulator [Phycisphaerae bacterium]
MDEVWANVRMRAAETLGQRLKRRRKELCLSQIELSRQSGINQGYVSEIERGRRQPSRKVIEVLAAAVDLPPAVLIGAGSEHDAPQPYEVARLPLFGSIPAGPPGESQEPLDLLPVLQHLWSADRYCLRLAFDCMEPTLKPGDVILVQYRPEVNPEHVQGKICACLVDGQPTLKRVSVGLQGGRRIVILRGDNPAVSPLVVDRESDFTIQGIVLALVSREL